MSSVVSPQGIRVYALHQGCSKFFFFCPKFFFLLLIFFARVPASANSITASFDPSIYQKKPKRWINKYMKESKDYNAKGVSIIVVIVRMNYWNVMAFLGKLNKSGDVECLMLFLTRTRYKQLSPFLQPVLTGLYFCACDVFIFIIFQSCQHWFLLVPQI